MRLRRAIVMAWSAACFAAGDAAAAEVHWGPRAGVSHSRLAGEYAEVIGDQDLRLLPNVGVAVEVELASYLGIRGEVAYVEKGTSSSVLVLDGSGDLLATYQARWLFQYLEFPLLLRSRIELGSGVSPYFEAGPSFAAALGGEVDSRIVPGPYSQENLRGGMSGLEFGVASGFGMEVQMGSRRLGLEARYTHGLTNLWKDDAWLPAYHQTWTFALSWLN